MTVKRIIERGPERNPNPILPAYSDTDSDEDPHHPPSCPSPPLLAMWPPNTLVRASEKLINLFQLLPEEHRPQASQTFFKYSTICNLMSTYIMTFKHRLFDLRDIRTIRCQEDPIGLTFNRTKIRRWEISRLIRSQLAIVAATDPIGQQ